jgi:hypothetical protein
MSKAPVTDPLAKPVEAASFTPGPWTIRPSRLSEGAHYVEGGETASKWLVAEVSGQGARNPSNARLIAAAPDLLDACERAERLFDSGPLRFSQEHVSELAAIRLAIQKATGQ